MDILGTGFFGQAAALQCRACVGAGLDCKVVARRCGKLMGLLAGGREHGLEVVAAVSTAWLVGKLAPQNQSSGDASTSLAVLW